MVPCKIQGATNRQSDEIKFYFGHCHLIFPAI